MRRGASVGVVGIPKTVDNDIPIIDKSFGFETAVEAAQASVDAAFVEATSFPNGVGIVQLMGRHSGFIALHSTLGSRNVDCVLIPEISLRMHGENGLLKFLEKKLREQGHVVVVVAEGCLPVPEEGEEGGRGEGGGVNAAGTSAIITTDVGLWLRKEVKKYFAAHPDPAFDVVSMKCIDPTYMVRSVKANAADNVYCTDLAHNAVHGVFAGYTNFMVGPVNAHHVYIPLGVIADRTNVVAVNDRVWAEVVEQTGQPDFPTAIDDSECLLDNPYGGCTVDVARTRQ